CVKKTSQTTQRTILPKCDADGGGDLDLANRI
ncbi:unnamed protein product, partial [marine sediment metagenome]